ncbi:MAG: C-type lectin domain-containing protein [Lentisphaerae bacterium]|nr:C-type lectin domain-containing protein [Lentisphaerota bacterium]
MNLLIALMILTMPVLSALAQTGATATDLKTLYKAGSSQLEAESKSAYVSALGLVRRTFIQSGDVDGVEAVDAEITRLEKGGMLDAGTTNANTGVSAVALRHVLGHDKKLSGWMDQYMKKLETAVKSSLQANKIEEAKLWKAELERIRLIKSEIDSRIAMQGGASDTQVFPSVPAAKKTAPADSVTFRGHHYKHFSEAVTWDAANMRCNHLGGHLVTISDAEENNFVLNLSGAWDTWIGLRKTGSQFVWVDKSPMNYTNWGPGQPDAIKVRGRMEVENAGVLIGNRQNQPYDWMGQWPGRWCDLLGNQINPDVKGFVCEWDY